MRYFVESVTTYTTTGKTRKGAMLQSAAMQFEHTVIGDVQALEALLKVFRNLVDACNAQYSGKPLKLNYYKDAYRIAVVPEERNTFADNTVFSMQLAPVGMMMYSSNVHQAVHSTVAGHGDTKFTQAFKNVCREAYRKGGAR